MNGLKAALATVAATAVVVGGITATTAAWSSTGGDHKEYVCHPVEGKGETGYGWNLIEPDKASSHIDEVTGAGKHTRKDGATDVYAVNGVCPGGPSESPTPTPTDTPTPTPVQFSGFSTPEPPTCDEPGSFAQVAAPGVTFTVEPEYNGPGTYTVTATLEDPEGTTFPDGTTDPKSVQVTVGAATGVTQSENPEGPCYLADTPEDPEDPTDTPSDTPSDTPGDTPTEPGDDPTDPPASAPPGSETRVEHRYTCTEKWTESYVKQSGHWVKTGESVHEPIDGNCDDGGPKEEGF